MEDKCWIDRGGIRKVRIDEVQRIVERIKIEDLDGVKWDVNWLAKEAVLQIVATIRGTSERHLKETVQVPDTWWDHLLYGICSMPMPRWLDALVAPVWLCNRIRWRTIYLNETHVRLCPHLPDLKNVPNGRTAHIAWLAGEDTWRKEC